MRQSYIGTLKERQDRRSCPIQKYGRHGYILTGIFLWATRSDSGIIFFKDTLIMNAVLEHVIQKVVSFGARALLPVIKKDSQ